MDAKTYKEGIVEMICFSDAPINMFNLKGKGFDKITAPLAKEMGISLGPEEIRNLVFTAAQAARDELKKDLISSLVYLKLDAATRGSRNFLAVNVQFWCKSKNKMLTKMLDIIDTDNQHSSAYIKQQVKLILEKFGISDWQVLSICVDNAANMVRAVNIFAENTEDSEEVDQIACEENITKKWCSEPQMILPNCFLEIEAPTQLMQCGIHTLQLAVWAGLNTEDSQKELKKIRQAVTKLRTATFRSILLKRFGFAQSAECVTRWGSTFLMLNRFLKFKDFCEEFVATGITELYLTADEWEAAKNTRDILAKPYITTLKLQAAELTPGTFFKEWCRLKRYFEAREENISEQILLAMEIREKNLFCNSNFLAAIYVHPRYRVLLTSEQRDLSVFNYQVRLPHQCQFLKLALTNCLHLLSLL